jgi:hypothetical protein
MENLTAMLCWLEVGCTGLERVGRKSNTPLQRSMLLLASTDFWSWLCLVLPLGFSVCSFPFCSFWLGSSDAVDSSSWCGACELHLARSQSDVVLLLFNSNFAPLDGTGTLGNVCFSFLCVDDLRALAPMVGRSIAFTGPWLLTFWFWIFPFVRWFQLLSCDPFSMKFVIGRRFDSLLSLTSCGLFFWVLLWPGFSLFGNLEWFLHSWSWFIGSRLSIQFCCPFNRQSCVRIWFISTRNSIPSIFNTILLGLACASHAEQRKKDLLTTARQCKR